MATPKDDTDETKLLREAGAVSMATLYQNLVHSSILSMQNAVQQQQNAWTVQGAVTARLVQQILAGGDIPYGDPLADLFDMDDFDDVDDADDEGEGPF